MDMDKLNKAWVRHETNRIERNALVKKVLEEAKASGEGKGVKIPRPSVVYSDMLKCVEEMDANSIDNDKRFVIVPKWAIDENIEIGWIEEREGKLYTVGTGYEVVEQLPYKG